MCSRLAGLLLCAFAWGEVVVTLCTAENVPWAGRQGTADEAESIFAIEIDGQERLTQRLGIEHSAVKCVGAASTAALHSRQEHPHPTISSADNAAGEETDYFGGPKERVCHLRNACLDPQNPALQVFLDPNLPDSDSNFLKAEGEDVLGARFFRLDTNCDSQNAAPPLVVHRESIPAGATHHEGTHVYLTPFGEDYFAHVVFDALFGAFMALQSLGLDPEAANMRILLSTRCRNAACRKFFFEWARAISHSTISLSELPISSALHCFQDVVVGVGAFTISGLFTGMLHGYAGTFRAFHRTFLRGLHIGARDMPAPRVHSVLINPKRGTKRVVHNFEEVQGAIEQQLGLQADLTPENIFDMTPRAQVMLLMDYTVVVTPVGTVSFTLFFARPGTSVIFISHVVWEDAFWRQVEHINDLVYVAQDDEVERHTELNDEHQWSAANVTVCTRHLLPLVVRAAQQQERWVDMRRGR